MIVPGDFIQATDSHTTMGGSLGALAYGVGTTEYAALIKTGFTFVEVPETIRFELVGRLPPGVTAKDVMLHVLAAYARRQLTLDRALEFGGPGLLSLSPDERAVLANMATECSAKAGLVEVDEATLRWIAQRRPGTDLDALRRQVVAPDEGAEYAGGVHVVDLARIEPMVATPGDAARGIPSDPTNGALIAGLGDVPIQIAYGGSCTAGKEDDLDQYATVMREALAAGRRVKEGVEFYIQFGSAGVEEYARRCGYLEIFARTGVKVIHPGCGACIGCGPGVSSNREQVTVSAINRNYQNRSGPGQLYLASPLSVAASAVEGRIVAYRAGMFSAAASAGS
jgi:homoaconitase/3-isopropylmalate dehydratase large subunit